MNFLNAAKCLHCGSVIQSRFRHEYVSCKCGAVSVDGGTSYVKRGGEAGSWLDILTDEDLAAALAEKAQKDEQEQE